MNDITAGQVESILGGFLLSGARDIAVGGVSIDTRTLLVNDLFFAIRGPHKDGHNYIPDALARGACGAVVDSRYDPAPDFPADRVLLRVDDSHQSLKNLAAYERSQWRGSLVAITGSMGKTTTKEFAAQILGASYGVYHSPGNYNNLFGLPLALLGLRERDHIGIFELGMSAPGEISEMCGIAKPDIGVITNVAPVHLEFFSSIEDIARAKGELAQRLPEQGTLVYNCDDPLVAGIAARFAGHKLSFGFSAGADVRAMDMEIRGVSETRFRIAHGGVTRRAFIPAAGKHFVWNALPAVALGIFFRLPMDQLVEGLSQLRQAKMRGQILQFEEGFTIIDDSYNSNPRALMQMTDTLCEIPGFRRRILVAGEMLELGNSSASMHHECGVLAARRNVSMLVGVQGAAQEVVRGASANGLDGNRSHFFAEVDQAAEFLNRQLQAGDLVLIKGSRGVHLEKMVQSLRSNHAEKER